MWHLRAALWALLLGLSGNVWAQTNAVKPAVPGNRYLLVVETSKVTDRRMPGMLQTVRDVLGTTLSGEMRTGDSLGIWTYNEALSTGRIPLQRWSPGAQNGMIGLITNMLAHERFQKQPHLEKVVPTLGSVVAKSPVLTVVLISSGTAEIGGTPFDDQINATFKRWRDQQQTKRMPFVTVFRAANGKMTGCAVAPAPWPLELPALPVRQPSLIAAQTAVQTNAAPAVKKATLPPLIVSGRKPQPAATNVVPHAVATNQALASMTAPAATPAETAKAEAPATAVAAGTQSGAAQPAEPATTSALPQAVPAAVSNAPVAGTTAASSNDLQSSSGAVASLSGTNQETRTTAMSSRSLEETLPTPSAPAISVGASRSHFFSGLLPLALAIAGLAAALGGWFFWQRGRVRVHRPISLITQSFEHKS